MFLNYRLSHKWRLLQFQVVFDRLHPSYQFKEFTNVIRELYKQTKAWTKISKHFTIKRPFLFQPIAAKRHFETNCILYFSWYNNTIIKVKFVHEEDTLNRYEMGIVFNSSQSLLFFLCTIVTYIVILWTKRKIRTQIYVWNIIIECEFECM